MFDFVELNKKYKEYWNKENHERPLLFLSAQKDNINWDKAPKALSDVRSRWLDEEFVVKKHRFNMENTAYLGEAFPQAWANLGPDILGAICGCDIEFGDVTSWAVHNLDDWDNFKGVKFDVNNFWFKKLQSLTESLVEDSKGEYVVGITDLHAGLDGLVSLRGPENLCLDLFDFPERVKETNFQIHEVFKKVYQYQYNAVTKYMPFTSNWMCILSDDREYATSCDFSCLISKGDFSEFVMPELMQELAFLDTSIYHLDGVSALTHLDALCAIPTLKGIQWVPGSGQKPMREWIDVLKKIQNSGKNIHINVEPEDVLPICENLNPEGVIMQCEVKSIEEGKELLNSAVKICTEKRAKTIQGISL